MKHFKDFLMADWNFYVTKYFQVDINTSKYFHNSKFVTFKEDLITCCGPDSYHRDMKTIANFSFSLPRYSVLHVSNEHRHYGNCTNE